VKPQKIKANKQARTLYIKWSDDHESSYSFSLLRAGCPCATCRGGHENMSPEPDPKIFKIQLPDSEQTSLKNIELVGSYALRALWNDGHAYGIYTWHYLRAMCPCETCRNNSEMHGL
jgi:DUF971 family protein